jgi:hypothetical protein
MKRLADSGAAKLREAKAKAPKRLTDQSANTTYTNIEAQLHKHEPKPLKTLRWKHEVALPRGIAPLCQINSLAGAVSRIVARPFSPGGEP